MAPLNPLLPDGITLTDWLASITDSHDPATIGTKTIDETGLSDGYTLIYDSASGTWKCQSGGGGGPHGSTHTNGTDNVAVSDGIQISGGTLQPVYGTVSGTVCQGNDTRLSDARTPTAHASTHAAAGSDPVTPAAIGAATSGHNHTGVYDPAGTAASAVSTHESTYSHSQLHSYKLQGAKVLYSHTCGQSYQYVGKTYQASYRTGYLDEAVAGITVDIDLLNILFPGGWKFWVFISGSTNSATGLNTLSVRLVNDTGGTIGAGTVIGERTAPLVQGSATQAWPLVTSGATYDGIGPFDTGTVPTSGSVTITYQQRCTESTKTSYTGNWTLLAVAT